MVKIIVMTGVILCNLLILTACVRVEVEVPNPKSIGGTNNGPPPDKQLDQDNIDRGLDRQRERGPGTSLRSHSIFLVQNEEKFCATDRKITKAVAQKTNYWCWAASAEGVLSFYKEKPLWQCDSVTAVKAGGSTAEDGTTPYCCFRKNHEDAICQQNGFTYDVFEKFNIDYRYTTGPLSEHRIADEICGNGPFTYSIEYSEGGGHTLVVRDYWMEEEEMWLDVDNHEYYTDGNGDRFPRGFKPLSFLEYKEGKTSRNSASNTVDYNFISINPIQD